MELSLAALADRRVAPGFELAEGVLCEQDQKQYDASNFVIWFKCIHHDFISFNKVRHCPAFLSRHVNRLRRKAT